MCRKRELYRVIKKSASDPLCERMCCPFAVREHGTMLGSADAHSWQAGTAVELVGLVKAAQHNGKHGRLSAREAQNGRVGVRLGDGTTLSVRRENVKLLAAPEVPDPVPRKDDNSATPKPRTLERNVALFQEFHGSPDPDSLVLYHHIRDGAFDAFNAREYHAQMMRYYKAGYAVAAVAPRRMQEDACMLVCLKHREESGNRLCELGFQCMRQFAGVTMLVKQRCFACHRPNAPRCGCGCVAFCTSDCSSSEAADEHKALCKLIRKLAPVIEEEVVQLF